VDQVTPYLSDAHFCIQVKVTLQACSSVSKIAGALRLTWFLTNNMKLNAGGRKGHPSLSTPLLSPSMHCVRTHRDATYSSTRKL